MESLTLSSSPKISDFTLLQQVCIILGNFQSSTFEVLGKYLNILLWLAKKKKAIWSLCWHKIKRNHFGCAANPSYLYAYFVADENWARRAAIHNIWFNDDEHLCLGPLGQAFRTLQRLVKKDGGAYQVTDLVKVSWNTRIIPNQKPGTPGKPETPDNCVWHPLHHGWRHISFNMWQWS